jgi:hypothetical protein
MKQSQALTQELFGKVGKIKLNDAAAIFGTTSGETNLQNLRKAVAELTAALANNAAYDETIQRYEATVAAVDTAGLTSLISEQEIIGYYKLTDDIWAAIEKEK